MNPSRGLTEFLLARIAETEAAAKEATHGPWTAYADGVVLGTSENMEVCRGVKTWNSSHIISQSPTRVLAECEAKRQIVALHGGGMHRCITGRVTWASECVETRILAAVYADHPDYRDEWKP